MLSRQGVRHASSVARQVAPEQRTKTSGGLTVASKDNHGPVSQLVSFLNLFLFLLYPASILPIWFKIQCEFVKQTLKDWPWYKKTVPMKYIYRFSLSELVLVMRRLLRRVSFIIWRTWSEETRRTTTESRSSGVRRVSELPWYCFIRKYGILKKH